MKLKFHCIEWQNGGFFVCFFDISFLDSWMVTVLCTFSMDIKSSTGGTVEENFKYFKFSKPLSKTPRDTELTIMY